MKTILTTAIIILSFTSFAQDNKEKELKKKEISFEVNGKCGMCKDRIQEALDLKGVKFAEWNQETHICKVIYDPRKISEEKIHQSVADVGHDTDQIKTTNEKYNNLHGCCKYDRK